MFQSTLGNTLGANIGTNAQQTNSGIFGQTSQNQQSQQGGSLFGSLGQSQHSQPGQTHQGPALFGGLGQNQQQQQQGGMLGGLAQSQANQLQQGGGGLFSGTGQSNQPLPGQQPLQNSILFGGSAMGQSQQQQQLPQLGQSSMWQPNSAVNPREKTIPEQMTAVLEKWDTTSPNCVFKYYFYNKIDDNMAPYYRPASNEDPKAWEEALSKKPGKGYIPVLCTGFSQIGERIKLQQRNLANFNARLHEINNSLSRMIQDHEIRTSVKALDARRKHIVLKQRCIALATKVQVLRNRGYALGGDEEDLKTKFLALEKQVNDPALGARGEEIWARMLAVQDRARLLKSEIEKTGLESPTILGEEMTRRAKKILEDYNTQLGHLSMEMDSIEKDYEAWVKGQGNPIPQPKEATKSEARSTLVQYM